MPKLKNKQKYYIILGDKGYTYGAFPRTPEGLKDAKKYVRKLKKNSGGDLVLHDPRFHNQISFTGPKTKVIIPTRGTLVAAPTYIWHEVSRYLGESTRLAVVCNCVVDFESKMRL